MQLAEGQVSLRALLLLGIRMLLTPVQRSQGHPSWRYVSSEVVIPKKEIHHGKGIQVPGWLSYSLHLGGQRHVIHMQRKKLLWPRHTLVMTQDDQGGLQMDYPYIPPDCYYFGYLEEIPLSMVTIDTCYGGLEGILKLDDLVYEIRPLGYSRRFEHVVSQIVADANAMGPTYRPRDVEDIDPFSEENLSVEPRISSKLYNSHASAIKGQVQCTYGIYTLFNNMTACVRYVINMFSLVDSFYRGLDIKYYIYILTIYDRADPFQYDSYAVPGGTPHGYFVRTFYNTLKPVSSVLLLRNGVHEANFEPRLYGMCQSTCLIFTTQLGRHYLLLAIIAANQMGRTLGLYYDVDHDFCVCQRRTSCIMARFPGLTDAFSNCSFKHIQMVFTKGGVCLFHENRVYHNRSLTETRCGNGVVENLEQCDCGSLKQCYNNPCCDTDCRLTSGSVCDKGTCCTNCSYAPTGTLCRSIQNICDLPEYCYGGSVSCPDDFYMQDGTPCTEEGYCFRGNCTDRTMHCMEIFGAGVQNGNEACYAINTGNFRFGHCRQKGETNEFIPCLPQDRTCGRLQCMNVTHLPQLQEHVSFHQSMTEGSVCFGLDRHRSTGTTDAGVVKTGSPCAPGKYCDNTFCSGSITELNYDCVPEKCGFRGICNNKRNCHCHVGWSPPQCLSPGAGGSADSGPPPRTKRSVRLGEQSMTYLRLIFGRIYVLIAVLLIGVATNVRSIQITKVTKKLYTKPKQKIASQAR